MAGAVLCHWTPARAVASCPLKQPQGHRRTCIASLPRGLAWSSAPIKDSRSTGRQPIDRRKPATAISRRAADSAGGSHGRVGGAADGVPRRLPDQAVHHRACSTAVRRQPGSGPGPGASRCRCVSHMDGVRIYKLHVQQLLSAVLHCQQALRLSAEPMAGCKQVLNSFHSTGMAVQLFSQSARCQSRTVCRSAPGGVDIACAMVNRQRVAFRHGGAPRTQAHVRADTCNNRYRP